MPSVFTQAQLQKLRAGDRVTFDNVQWQVNDYSTYNDANGYETAEWLLWCTGKGERYLLREVDPVNPEQLVNWYFSQEINISQVSGEHTGDNLKFAIWQAMRDQAEPYPVLNALGRAYNFESKTTGDYNGPDGTVSRTTWDYWDDENLWNLAIEAWREGDLHVYVTRTVDPVDFSEVEKSATPLNLTKQNSASDRTWQWAAAWSLTIGGILLMMFGGW